MLIELASPEDAPEILQLQKLAYQSEAAIYNDYSIGPLIQTLDQMIVDIQKVTVLKMIMDSQIVGSVRGRVQNGTGYIGRLMVHPEYQSRGLGKHLLHEIETRLKPVSRYELFTGQQSQRNLHLYQKQGYRIFRQEPANDHFVVYMEKVIK
jgi:ribosomal protein S18 acetylase RimI-like enzyme